VPACHPRALCSSLFSANRMRGPALFGPSLWTPHGRYVTPGASTGAKHVRQLARADAQCSGQCPRILTSRPAAPPGLEPAVVQANKSPAFSLRIIRSKMVPRMHWRPSMIGNRSPPQASGLCAQTGTSHIG
jgi:hypothetical protein